MKKKVEKEVKKPMNMKAYGNEMLEKQLKAAEEKGNKEYADALKKELDARASRPKRSSAKRSAMQEVSAVAGSTHTDRSPKVAEAPVVESNLVVDKSAPVVDDSEKVVDDSPESSE